MIHILFFLASRYCRKTSPAMESVCFIGNNAVVAGDDSGEVYVWDIRGSAEILAPQASHPVLCCHSQNGNNAGRESRAPPAVFRKWEINLSLEIFSFEKNNVNTRYIYF